jgi:hypothetical protein
MLGGSVHTIMVVVINYNGLEVNAGRTIYMVMSGDQNAGGLDWYRGYGATTPCAPRP